MSERERLLKILQERVIRGSSTDSGFVVGSRPASCFIDAPLYSICENLHYERDHFAQRERTPYSAYGLMFPKDYIYTRGGRPVIYDRTDEAKRMLPAEEHWRIVKLDLSDPNQMVDWTHEREWRVPGNLCFDLSEATVLVSNAHDIKWLFDTAPEVARAVPTVVWTWACYL